jgi:hypothetical protein
MPEIDGARRRTRRERPNRWVFEMVELIDSGLGALPGWISRDLYRRERPKPAARR